ncbi:MAG: BlaI/MecI/CopY family transcriptional regulator [bacterium]|nr:BlaI/MecI/CopY family transcriptional regulator [bacterium]
MPRHPAISETEMHVLKVLWDEDAGTVREIRDLLRKRRRRWAYTTVQTLLNRLREKGYVARDESGMAHVFRAAVTRDRLIGWRLKELADQVCEGASTPLVLNLVQSQPLSDDDIAKLRRLLDQAEASDS